jgi:hypothetical protein
VPRFVSARSALDRGCAMGCCNQSLQSSARGATRTLGVIARAQAQHAHVIITSASAKLQTSNSRCRHAGCVETRTVAVCFGRTMTTRATLLDRRSYEPSSMHDARYRPSSVLRYGIGSGRGRRRRWSILARTLRRERQDALDGRINAGYGGGSRWSVAASKLRRKSEPQRAEKAHPPR